MSIEVWYGNESHHEAEQKTLFALYQHLHPQQEHFVLLHNFLAGESNEIDMVLLKRDGIFLVELKHVLDPIVGDGDGEWKAIHEDGSETVLDPDRPNPFKRIQRNYGSWRDWCQKHAEEISVGLERSAPVDWTDVMRYIVLYPDLPESSSIDIGDRPVQAVGLPAFKSDLISRSSDKVDLSYQEMTRIPRLLGLERWRLTQTTERLSEWQPPPVAALAARGHTLSMPLFRLDKVAKPVIVVGRDPETDLIIDHPTVSRRHAQLYYRDERWIVRDLDSVSGTYVSYRGDPDDEYQVVSREFALKNHSIVRFGPAAYTLLLQDEEQ